VDQDNDCSEPTEEYQLPPSFWQSVNGLDSVTGPAIAEIISLYLEFPAWAVWLPRQGSTWTAVRPATSRFPGPDFTMIWVYADTADELAERMRSVEW
jgi:hypothetical protein